MPVPMVWKDETAPVLERTKLRTEKSGLLPYRFRAKAMLRVDEMGAQSKIPW